MIASLVRRARCGASGGATAVKALRGATSGTLGALLAIVALGGAPLQAQQRPPRARAPEPPAPAVSPQALSTARAQAPFDATGYWVSLVTQNWRYRMVLPARGDYAGIPVNARAEQFASAWNAAADTAAGRQCEAYGAPNLMQIPERLHIRWQDDDTLRVDTDAGRQTRLLHFKADSEAAASAPSRQGYSLAQWQLFNLANSFGAPDEASNTPRHGSLVVTTDHLLPGLLRKNGVPYGPDTKMSEYWKLQSLQSTQWLTISTSIKDPEYLTGPYVYDSIFQREADGSQSDPGPCSLTS